MRGIVMLWSPLYTVWAQIIIIIHYNIIARRTENSYFKYHYYNYYYCYY